MPCSWVFLDVILIKKYKNLQGEGSTLTTYYFSVWVIAESVITQLLEWRWICIITFEEVMLKG